MAAKQQNSTDDMPGVDDMPGGPGVDMDSAMGALMNGSTGVGHTSAFFGSLDMSNVSGGTLVALPNGEDYDFYIQSVSMGKSGPGNAVARVKLEVTEDYAEAGSCIMDTVTFTEAAMWKAKSLFDACGMLSDAGTYMGNNEKDLVGFVVHGKVKTEPYNGEDRSKVDGGYKVSERGKGARRESGGAPVGLGGATPNFG